MTSKWHMCESWYWLFFVRLSYGSSLEMRMVSLTMIKEETTVFSVRAGSVSFLKKVQQVTQFFPHIYGVVHHYLVSQAVSVEFWCIWGRWSANNPLCHCVLLHSTLQRQEFISRHVLANHHLAYCGKSYRLAGVIGDMNEIKVPYAF